VCENWGVTAVCAVHCKKRVLRIWDLFHRGIATAMNFEDFSVAVQWRPLAAEALHEAGLLDADPDAFQDPSLKYLPIWAGGFVPFGYSPSDVRW
jgi:hypothetical protein